MEFLTTRLQGITGHQLVVTPIYDFLHSLCHGLSLAGKSRVEEFHTKWGSSTYAKQIIVGYIMGSWKPPSAARTKQILYTMHQGRLFCLFLHTKHFHV